MSFPVTVHRAAELRDGTPRDEGGPPGESGDPAGVVTVRAFGRLTDIVPAGTWLAVVFPVSVATLRNALRGAFPDVSAIPMRFAVDGTLVGDDDTIADATEIALFPPFAGG